MSFVDSQTRRVFLGTLAAGAAASAVAVEIKPDPAVLSADPPKRFRRPGELLFTSSVACEPGSMIEVEGHNGFTGVYVITRVTVVASQGLFMYRCAYYTPRVAKHPLWQFSADIRPQHWMPIYRL
jgi:hypothetical protein